MAAPKQLCTFICVVLGLVLQSQGQTDQSWKSFSSRAGWSIRYPSYWKISSCRACSDPTAAEVFAEFEPPPSANKDSSGVSIDRFAEKPSNKSALEFLSEMKATELKSRKPRGLRERERTVGGFPALEFSYYDGGMGFEEVYVVAGSHSFRILFAALVRDQLEQLDTYKVYRRMLTTFRAKL